MASQVDSPQFRILADHISPCRDPQKAWGTRETWNLLCRGYRVPKVQSIMKIEISNDERVQTEQEIQ